MKTGRRATKLPPDLKATIEHLSDHHARAHAIALYSIQRRVPRPQNLLMLAWDDLTVKAHRNQKQAAQEVFKRCTAIGIPKEIAQEQATFAAAKVGEPYYKSRKSPHANDPVVRGFFQPPEWREQQRLEGIAAAKAERERLAAQVAAPRVRRRPGGKKPEA